MLRMDYSTKFYLDIINKTLILKGCLSMVKYHISKNTNRPNICKAKVKDCPLGENTPHFDSKEEAKLYIEDMNASTMDMFSTTSKKTNEKTNNRVISQGDSLKESLLESDFYLQYSAVNPMYFQANPEMSKIAVEVMKSIELTDFSSQDFTSKLKKVDLKVSSHVKILPLTNGDVGYYKSLPINYKKLTSVDSYETTNLKMMLNEVRAYNVAKVMGYEDLVPETIIAQVSEDDFGSLQKGVKGGWGRINNIDKEELTNNKRAAIFDFVIGSQDRHDNNYLFQTKANGSRTVALIDNSYAFPDSDLFYLNRSDFVCTESYKLNSNDVDNLSKLQKELATGALGAQFSLLEKQCMNNRIEYLKDKRSTTHMYDYFEHLDPDFNEDAYEDGYYF